MKIHATIELTSEQRLALEAELGGGLLSQDDGDRWATEAVTTALDILVRWGAQVDRLAARLELHHHPGAEPSADLDFATEGAGPVKRYGSFADWCRAHGVTTGEMAEEQERAEAEDRV